MTCVGRHYGGVEPFGETPDVVHMRITGFVLTVRCESARLEWDFHREAWGFWYGEKCVSHIAEDAFEEAKDMAYRFLVEMSRAAELRAEADLLEGSARAGVTPPDKLKRIPWTRGTFAQRSA